jgi:two-component system, chemotaxis family, CheB/CheR fusion protein
MLSIEVWDTGIGIPAEELEAVFEEYHQLDNPARERARGLGLGLTIVQRLGDLLGHRVNVHSHAGKGSVFTIEAMVAPSGEEPELALPRHETDKEARAGTRRTGAILVVEDDPDVCELLELFLKEERYSVVTAPDGVAAMELLTPGAVRPDLILADYNLPNGMNGLQLVTAVREKLHREIPAIVLTGDISTATLSNIARQNCIQFNKPVKLEELAKAIQRFLPISQPAVHSHVARIADVAGDAQQPVVFVVDDDSNVREAIRTVVEEEGQIVEDYASCEAFLASYRAGHEACLVIDAYLPGMNGLELLQHLRGVGHLLPAIMITGNSDVQTAVRAMKAGASDFIEKPFNRTELLASIKRAFEQSRDSAKLSAWREDATNRLAGLTPRQREIMERVLAGDPSKNIAADLGISQRTVENHRAAIMTKTGSKSLPALARLALAASSNSAD